MKSIGMLILAGVAIGLIETSAAPAKKACCEATVEAEKKCEHKCCVKAAEDRKICKKCHKEKKDESGKN